MTYNIIPRLPPEFTITNDSTTIGYMGFAPSNGDFYLFGEGDDVSKWVSTVIHEEHHRILHDMGVDSKHHHPMMDAIGV